MTSEAWEDIGGRAPAVQNTEADLATWQPPSLPFGLTDWLERDSASWPTGITIREAMAKALSAIIAQFRDGLEPHHPAAFEQAMMELAVVFPNNRAGPAELKARITAYSAALEDVPSDLVLKAARRAIRSCEHFPKPAELRKLVEEDLIARRRKLHRAQLIARLPVTADSVGMIERKAEADAITQQAAKAWRA